MSDDVKSIIRMLLPVVNGAADIDEVCMCTSHWKEVV